MVTFKWLFVNLLTATRLPLSYYCCKLAWQEQWLEASIIAYIATLTDILDGYLANKFEVKSDFGFYLDKGCDLWMIIAISAGLKDYCPWYFYFIFAGLHLVLWTIIITRSRQDKLRIFCRTLSPFHSVGLMITLNIIYSFVAFKLDVKWLLLAILIVLATAYLKWYRVKSWLKGQG